MKLRWTGLLLAATCAIAPGVAFPTTDEDRTTVAALDTQYQAAVKAQRRGYDGPHPR